MKMEETKSLSATRCPGATESWPSSALPCTVEAKAFSGGHCKNLSFPQKRVFPAKCYLGIWPPLSRSPIRNNHKNGMRYEENHRKVSSIFPFHIRCCDVKNYDRGMHYSIRSISGEKLEEKIAELKKICQSRNGYLQGKQLLFAKCKSIIIYYKRPSTRQSRIVNITGLDI